MRGSTAGSSDLRASRFAVLKDSGVKGEGAAGQKNDPNAKQQTAGKGKGGGKSGPGNAKNGPPRGKSSKSGAAGKKGSPRQDQSGDKKGQDDRSDNKADRGKDAEQDAKENDQNGSEKNDDQSSQENQNPSDAANPPPQAAIDAVSGPVLVARAVHGGGCRGLDFRPLSLRAGVARCPPRLDRLAVRRFWVPEAEETGEGSRGRSERTGRRRPGLSPRSPIRSPVGSPRISVPMTWSSTVSRRSRPGLSSTISPARRTRRPANSSTGWDRPGPTCARTRRDWPDISSRSSMAKKASKPRSCRRSASSGGHFRGCPPEFAMVVNTSTYLGGRGSV